ncbi:taurine ABC transporter substrate-binding protein [Zavarzinia compransoris]|uniref:Taurine ABC transporter substrate-binding protein n=1 Tax=Zavarzinia compransoris TaxID=1264899 RepID=A0A317DSZ1_9PROT|nr:taurine ABC transporter substrate-binding protein [Zavarzinia compransoris]PWR17789.1 taurine ABC transporter substrate-binding protein [Zavarzinia compransoris]TDP49319.1 taurine transport system substrate-binding protein [Zavarzinia compransoris]
MTRISRRGAMIGAALLGTALLAGGPARADEQSFTIAYQTTVEPSKVPQADGAYEKATGWKIDWRKFDSGAEVITAVASGDIDIGYVGSSPLAAAASRELPIKTIFVVGIIGSSEALVTRNGAGIGKPADLAGKKVAVPFVSTTHYSLLAALKHWQIDPKTVSILNLRPPEIAAAWARGDIDAAYVWDPALGQIKGSGAVLVTSEDVGKWGAPTFDAWIVRSEFAEKHPEIVRKFVKVTGDAYAAFRADGAKWTATSPEAEKIARLTGAKPEEVPGLLTGYVFPTLAEQAGNDLLGGGIAKAIADASAFLKEQGKIPAVLSDYGAYVTSRFVTEAQAAK